MNNLMGTELYEYFTEMDSLTYLLSDLLGAPTSDMSLDIIDDYVTGRIEYDELIAQMTEAIASFDWKGYAENE
ncbi:hypothetical protein [Psychrobacillus sp. OK032]|uniref:hypothetical protein n=1 Tax=Psychrobacillus sp. OK032 TaxID=1884358 RepID=UPI0015A5F7AA|nr:hypothetical protein [Psychrobacillus sp. OK032]